MLAQRIADLIAFEPTQLEGRRLSGFTVVARPSALTSVALLPPSGIGAMGARAARCRAVPTANCGAGPRTVPHRPVRRAFAHCPRTRTKEGDANPERWPMGT